MDPSIRHMQNVAPRRTTTRALSRVRPTRSITHIATCCRTLFTTVRTRARLPAFHNRRRCCHGSNSVVANRLRIGPRLSTSNHIIRVLNIAQSIDRHGQLRSRLRQLTLASSLANTCGQQCTGRVLPVTVGGFRHCQAPTSILLVSVSRFGTVGSQYNRLINSTILARFTHHVTRIIHRSSALIQ